MQGPFAVGTQVSMIPKGQDPIVSTITDIRENEFYADEMDLGDVKLHFSHTLTRLADTGTRITHRLEITGPAAREAGPQMGPAITAGPPGGHRREDDV